MSKLTSKYIDNSGIKVSANRHKNSITIQYANQLQYNRILRKIKYQSKWCTYSTGHSLRINFSKNIPH